MIMFSRPCSQTLNVIGSVSVGRSVLSVCVCVCVSVHTFSLKLWLWWLPNLDMWVRATGARHSMSGAALSNKSMFTSCVMI